MIGLRERQLKRTPPATVKLRGVAIPPALVRWAQAIRLLPPVKSSRERDRIQRIAYL